MAGRHFQMAPRRLVLTALQYMKMPWKYSRKNFRLTFFLKCHRGFLFFTVDPVKITVFRYIIKKVATNTNSKEIFDFYEKQQRKLKKIKRRRPYEKRTAVRT